MQGGLGTIADRAVALSFHEADSLLQAWALTAPVRTSHEVKVEVLWADGFVFEGKFPLMHRAAKRSGLIQNWARNTLALIGGLWKPTSMSAREYAETRAQYGPKEQEISAQALEEYEL